VAATRPISPRLLPELPFKWRDLVPGAAVCTVAALIVHAATAFFLRNWVAAYGHAYGGHKAGPAAVAAMEELSAEISASEQSSVSGKPTT